MSLKNSQFQAIERHYDLIRQKHRRELESRYDIIRKSIPQYSVLEDEIISLSASQAKAAILGRQGMLSDFKKQLASRMNEQKMLLKAAGYPPDYLEMTYDCKDCKDTGYINEKKCHCFKQVMVELLYDQSGKRDILQRENFNTFSVDLYSDEKDRKLGISPRDNILSILTLCRQFTKDFDTKGGNILFYGGTGVGKTFLTNCIAKELLDTSHTVIYISAFDLADIIREKAFNRDETDDYGETMSDYILDCDLLIIDDLGTEYNNEFICAQFFFILNERLNRNKSVVISTNLSLEKLQDEYGERLFSRFVSNYDILKVLGDDNRIKTKLMEVENGTGH